MDQPERAESKASIAPRLEWPVISVVTVNFNAGPLLARSVRAALASTEPVEVIVVDNASTDGSLEALRGELGGEPRRARPRPGQQHRLRRRLQRGDARGPRRARPAAQPRLRGATGYPGHGAGRPGRGSRRGHGGLPAAERGRHRAGGLPPQRAHAAAARSRAPSASRACAGARAPRAATSSCPTSRSPACRWRWTRSPAPS